MPNIFLIFLDFIQSIHRRIKKLSSPKNKCFSKMEHTFYTLRIMFRIFETYGSIVTISFVLFPAFLSSHSALISFASSRAFVPHAFLLQNANSKDSIIA